MHRHELEGHVPLFPLPAVFVEMGDNSLDEAVEKLRLRNRILLLDGLPDGVKLVDERLGRTG